MWSKSYDDLVKIANKIISRFLLIQNMQLNKHNVTSMWYKTDAIKGINTKYTRQDGNQIFCESTYTNQYNMQCYEIGFEKQKSNSKLVHIIQKRREYFKQPWTIGQGFLPKSRYDALCYF